MCLKSNQFPDKEDIMQLFTTTKIITKTDKAQRVKLGDSFPRAHGDL